MYPCPWQDWDVLLRCGLCWLVQEAQDIFGDADELLEEFRARPRFEQQEAPEDDEDLDAEDLGDDDEARAERLRAVVSSQTDCQQQCLLLA